MDNICLVKTPVPELQDDRLDPPMGLLYLGTVLQNAGIEVVILDLSGIPESEWVFPETEWYGFSTYTASYNRTVRIKNIVKNLYPSVKTVAGGPHASVLPHEVIDEFDHVITGEGEESLLRLLLNIPSNSIIAGVPLDIDCIPIPDYSLVDVASYTRRYLEKDSFQLFTSRGCPYRCGFCSKLPGGHKIRKRKVETLVEEIAYIRKEYGDVTFRIKDDLFASNLEWLREFQSHNIGIEYSCNIRADYKPGLPAILAETGCRTACIGIESGSNKVLDSMQKGTTRQQNIDAIKGLQEVGIDVLAWVIVGYPGETHETVAETISLIEEAQPDIVRAYPLIPYPGTKVCNQVKIVDTDYDHYFYICGNNDHGFVYETEELSRTDIMSMMAQMDDYLSKVKIRVK